MAVLNFDEIDYKFGKDEIFKRMKATTFVQLVSWSDVKIIIHKSV